MVTYAEETKLKTIKANWDLVGPILDQIENAAIDGNFSIKFNLEHLLYKEVHLIFLTLKSLDYSLNWDGESKIKVSWWKPTVYEKGEI